MPKSRQPRFDSCRGIDAMKMRALFTSWTGSIVSLSRVCRRHASPRLGLWRVSCRSAGAVRTRVEPLPRQMPGAERTRPKWCNSDDCLFTTCACRPTIRSPATRATPWIAGGEAWTMNPLAGSLRQTGGHNCSHRVNAGFHATQFGMGAQASRCPGRDRSSTPSEMAARTSRRRS
jgi:hypothetical protein